MRKSYTRYKVYNQNWCEIFVSKQVLIFTYKVIIGSQGGKVSMHEKQYQATYYLLPFVFYKLSMHSLITVCRGHPSQSYYRRVGIGTGRPAIFMNDGATFSFIARKKLNNRAVFHLLRAIYNQHCIMSFYCAQRLITVYKQRRTKHLLTNRTRRNQENKINSQKKSSTK